MNKALTFIMIFTGTVFTVFLLNIVMYALVPGYHDVLSSVIHPDKEEIPVVEVARPVTAAAEAEAEAEAEETASDEETDTEDDKTAENPSKNTKVRVTAKVNVRESASTGAGSLGQVKEGTELTKYKEEGDWTQIDYNGTKAYIKTEYLEAAGASDSDTEEEDETDTQEEAGADTEEEEKPSEASSSAANFGPGDKVRVSDSINVRQKMDETSKKIAVAYQGTEVTIVKIYSNGWTGVKVNGIDGYMKTDLIK